MKKSIATATAAAALVCAGLAVPAAASAADTASQPAAGATPVAQAATTPFTVTSPVTPLVTSSRTPVFTGTAPAGTVVEIRGFLGAGPALASGVADADGRWSVAVTTPFTDDGATGTVVATSGDGIYVAPWTLSFVG